MAFTIEVGQPAPDFKLPGVDGKTWTLSDFADANLVVVAFTCNHCPYVIGSEERIMLMQQDYRGKGLRLLAINSNETENHPEDSFDKMVKRAQDRGFCFPYLRDDDQSVAKAYGAIKTPQFFLLDKERIVRYTGRLDDQPRDASLASTSDLRAAIEDLLASRPVRLPVTEPMGCTIKWWGKDRKFIPGDVCDLL